MPDDDKVELKPISKQKTEVSYQFVTREDRAKSTTKTRIKSGRAKQTVMSSMIQPDDDFNI